MTFLPILQDGATVLRQSDFSTGAGKGGSDKQGVGAVEKQKGFQCGSGLVVCFWAWRSDQQGQRLERIQGPGMSSMEPPDSLVILREGVNL